MAKKKARKSKAKKSAHIPMAVLEKRVRSLNAKIKKRGGKGI